MGQKTNPIINQLGKTKIWKSQYFEKKLQDSKNYSYNDIAIRKFITKFFKDNNLLVHNCKIYYFDNNLIHIVLSYMLMFNVKALTRRITKKQRNRIQQLRRRKFIRKKLRLRIVSKKRRNFIKRRQRLQTIFVRNFINYQTKISYNKILKKHVLKKDKAVVKRWLKRKLCRKRRLYKRFSSKRYFLTRFKLVKKYKQAAQVNYNSFFKKFFESLHLFLSRSTKIFLTLEQVNKHVKKTVRIVKKKKLKTIIMNLRRYHKEKFFKEMINNLFLVIINKNSADLLTRIIATQLNKFKRHYFFLRFLITALSKLIKTKVSIIDGIKLKIKGRINKSRRRRRRLIQIGKGVPVLSLNSGIDYSENIAFTQNGTLGIKAWIYYKKNVISTKTNKIQKNNKRKTRQIRV